MLDIIKEKLLGTAITVAVSAAFSALIAWVTSKRNQKKKAVEEVQKQIEELKERDEIFKCAIRSILRQNIINVHDKYMSRGWAEIYVKDNMQDMYKIYTELDGNGTVPGLVNEFMELPTSPTYKEEDLK